MRITDAEGLPINRIGHIRFLISLFLTTILLLGLPYIAVFSDTLYCKHSKLFWNSTDCSKYALHGNAADIIFIGDSSLVFGVRPDIIKNQTGLSAFNLGLPAGAVLFYPDLLLDHYLSMNRAPKLIVLYASPWTFTRDPAGFQHLMDDALAFTIRHGSVLQVVRVFSRDPTWIIRFPALAVEREDWRHMTISGAVPQRMSEEVRRGDGWLAYRDMSDPDMTPAILRGDCRLKPRPLGVPDQDKVQRLKDKYASLGIKVLFYVAPVPSCDQSYREITAVYAGKADNHPQRLPSADFIDDDWRTHLDAKGATEATGQLVDFLRHSGQLIRGPSSSR